MTNPLNEQSIAVLRELIDKNFNKHYRPKPLDPPNTISFYASINKKELEQANNPLKKQLERGLFALIKIWTTKNQKS